MTKLHSNRLVRCLSGAIASTLVMGLSSCVSGSPPSSNSGESQTSLPATEGEKLEVMTTFVPITGFTKAVAGDRAEVTQLLPTKIGPHDYQAKPEDVQKLARADVLVKNGLEMEIFLDDMVKNAENQNLKLIDSSQGIETLSNEEIEEHEHQAEESKAEVKHERGEFNPHIWLDPKRAVRQVENIRDGLIAVDPAGKETYTANASAYIKKLKQLDVEVTEKLKPFVGKTFVTYHDFAPYFAQSYQLKTEFLVDIPEENASPQDVKRVIDAAKQSNLKTLLTEPQAVGDRFSALAKDLNVGVSYFDPIETAATEGVAPDYYLEVMRQNVANLETAFAEKSLQSFLPIPLHQRPAAIVSQPHGLSF